MVMEFSDIKKKELLEKRKRRIFKIIERISALIY